MPLACQHDGDGFDLARSPAVIVASNFAAVRIRDSQQPQVDGTKAGSPVQRVSLTAIFDMAARSLSNMLARWRIASAGSAPRHENKQGPAEVEHRKIMEGPRP